MTLVVLVLLVVLPPAVVISAGRHGSRAGRTPSIALFALLRLLLLVVADRRMIGNKRWRSIHRATIVVWAFAVVHTLGAGTDAGSLWLQGILVVTGLPIIFLFLRRIIPASKPKPAPLPDSTPVERAAARARARVTGAKPAGPSPS